MNSRIAQFISAAALAFERPSVAEQRARLCSLLAEHLADPEFVAAVFRLGTSARTLVHEDPTHGYCIVSHQFLGAKTGTAHDHGSTWSIYGQAAGNTLMANYLPAGISEPSGIRRIFRASTYTLREGDVYLYNEGDIHAPSRSGDTRLIRIEGANMAAMTRTEYLVAG